MTAPVLSVRDLHVSFPSEAGRVDVLFANAGGGSLLPLGSITGEQYDDTFGRNVKGVLFTVQKALPLLVDGASVIMTGSTAAAGGTPGFSVYAASKAAVRSFARNWILDLRDRGIRVNILSPGTIDTPILDPFGTEAKERFKALIPRGGMGRPEEIATVALFLASNDSSFVNGIELFVDGGTAQI